MNIQPINDVNPNFNGKLIAKGKFTKNLRQAIMNNESLKSLVNNSECDLVVKMSSKKASTRDLSHVPGEKLFQLSIYTLKSTFFNKLKTTLGMLPKASEQRITQSYHRENSMLGIIDDRLDSNSIMCEKLKKKLYV